MSRVWILLAGLTSVVFLGCLGLLTFQSTSTCSVCGCRGNRADWQIPFTSLTYFRSESVNATPLADLGKRLGIVPQHHHNWQLIHGAGNGITCAIGGGSDLDRNARSTQINQFIADTARYREVQEASQWFQRALDREDAMGVHQWLGWEDYPEAGFGTAAEYEDWRADHDTFWPEALKASRSRFGGP